MIAGDRPSRGAIPDLLMLAAVDRAVRHRADKSAVPIYGVKEHLGLPTRSLGVRVKLAALEQAGALQRKHVHGAQAWELSTTGRRRLQLARRAGDLPELPESPQHRAWRQARASAEAEIDSIRLELRGALEAATALIDAPSHSDDWFEHGERLEHDCRRMAVAIHCLHEWREPDDARPDIDERVEPTDKGLDPVERLRRSQRRLARRLTPHHRADAPNG